MSYFDGIKVGDKVWELNKEEPHTVATIIDHETYPIKLSNAITITINGQYNTNKCPQTYFWDKVIITPPPRPQPKRMVEKVVEGWINIYIGGVGNVCCGSFHATRAEADEIRSINSRLGEAHFVRHVYTVEE